MNNCIITITVNTIREVVRQALFYFIIGGGILLILSSFSFTMFAFGEETRMIKEMGISTIIICCLALASVSASNTIASEIESGTLMTLLSKPASRDSVILGKFFGILAAVFLAFVTMGAFLTISLCIRHSLEYHTHFLASFLSVGTVTSLQLPFSFLQVAMMSAVAFAGAVYLPMASNLSCCIFIYIIGNLSTLSHHLYTGNEVGFPWYAPIFYLIFPNLECLNTFGMASCFENFSLLYILLMIIYATLYTMLVMTLTLKIFNYKECR